MRRTTQSHSSFKTFPCVNPNAAGLDIGSAEIWACVPTERDPQPIRRFGTFTPDLHALADWLLACQVQTVAMESTGVYWIPIYEILEARGMGVFLVNAHHLKHVPGRKSDIQDCQWIQRLHSFGLLSPSFRPAAEMCALRAYLRHRNALLEHRAAHILHMQKALQQMNLQLGQVLTDITGETGLAIVRAIVAGEQDPVHLARFRNPHCKHSTDEIAQALTGNYRPEHLFALKQAVALFDFYTEQLRECDDVIERQFQALRPVTDQDPPPLVSPRKRNSHSQNAPTYDARTLLFHVTGVDLVAISGLNVTTVQTILAEIGTDMTRWRSVKHFCSWLGLAPHNEISGGRILRSHTLKTHNRAGQAFRLAARTVRRSPNALGAYYRRLKSRAGPQIANVATAHKIARTFYCMLQERRPFEEMSAAEYDQRFRDREVSTLRKRAAKLGLTLVDA